MLVFVPTFMHNKHNHLERRLELRIVRLSDSQTLEESLYVVARIDIHIQPSLVRSKVVDMAFVVPTWAYLDRTAGTLDNSSSEVVVATPKDQQKVEYRTPLRWECCISMIEKNC